MRTEPTLKYYLSDTYGPRNENPLTADRDVDVFLETDLSRLEYAMQHGGQQSLDVLQIHEKMNIHGRERAVSQHIVELLERWHDQYRHLLEKQGIYSGLFVNYASRDIENDNGEEFYVLETDGGLRIVASPLASTDSIREHVIRAWRVPNTGSGVFPDGTQFRSRDAHNLLNKDHPYAIEKLNINELAPVDERLRDLRLRYVDVYGNLITSGQKTSDLRAQILQAAPEHRRARVIVGDVALDAEAAASLAQARPGVLSVYPNGGNPHSPNIDIVRKWKPGDDRDGTSVRESAYQQFQKPLEGESNVQIQLL